MRRAKRRNKMKKREEKGNEIEREAEDVERIDVLKVR